MPPPQALLAAAAQAVDRAEAGVDPQRLQRALDSVFGQPAFRRELERVDAQAVDWRQLVLERVAELWGDLLDWLSELHGASPLLYWLLFSALVILLLALLGHIGWTLRRSFSVDLPAQDESGAARERVQRYGELRDQASRMAARGSLREAARLLLLALLALIEERKVLHLARGWTNREILQRLQLPPAEGAALRLFRERVEGAWYGGHALEMSQLEELAACVDRWAGILRAPQDAEAAR